MKESLEKILKNLLKEQYPKIMNFHVSKDEFGYSVGVYLKYKDMSVLTTQDIQDLKKEIRNCGKYVLGSNERINNVYFYDPQ